MELTATATATAAMQSILDNLNRDVSRKVTKKQVCKQQSTTCILPTVPGNPTPQEAMDALGNAEGAIHVAAWTGLKSVMEPAVGRLIIHNKDLLTGVANRRTRRTMNSDTLYGL